MKRLILGLPTTFTAPALPERIEWTGSAVKTFRSCPRLFFWKYIARLGSKAKPAPLLIGTSFHTAVAHWYKAPRASMEKIAARVIGEASKEYKDNQAWYNVEDIEKMEVALKTFEGMLQGYATNYESDRANWRFGPKDVEVEFKIDMGDFDFRGSIDLIPTVRSTGKRAIVENKTASDISESYLDRLSLDTQTRGYLFGATRGLGLKISQVIYNVTRKCKLRRRSGESHQDFTRRIVLDYTARPDFYFYREPLPITQDCIEAFELELRQTHHALMSMIGRMKDPLDPREWYINDNHCTAYHRTCDFHRLCVTGLDAGTGTMFEQHESFHRELSV